MRTAASNSMLDAARRVWHTGSEAHAGQPGLSSIFAMSTALSACVLFRLLNCPSVSMLMLPILAGHEEDAALWLHLAAESGCRLVT